MKKVITWVDLQGRYRVTSPAYDNLMRRHSTYDEDGVVILQFTEDDCIAWTWAKVVESGGYGIPADHPHFEVEDAVMRAKLATIEGQKFRYPPQPNLDKLPGAWEMDVDGTPKVNMVKAQALGLVE